MENNEQNNNMTKKGAGFLIIIVALLVVIFGLGGYILYDKVLSDDAKDNTEEKGKEVEKKEENTEKVENLEVTNEEVTELFGSIMNGWMLSKNCGVVYDYFTDKKVTVTDMNYDTVTAIVLSNLNKSGVNFNEGSTFTKKQVDDITTKLFGKNYKYTHKNINTCPNFTYDESKELYTVQKSACGGECGPYHSINKIVKATKSDSKIELYVRVLFLDDTNASDPVKYYSDYNKTKEVDIERVEDTKAARETDANYSKGSLYKMTFTKEDNNYVFTSSEPVNE